MNTLPWEEEGAPEHVRKRQPVCELGGPRGVRRDLARRAPADEMPLALQGKSYGVAVMTHRGCSNGRLSVCLSSIPENYPVVVCSDSVDPKDIYDDSATAEYHGASFHHIGRWGGRAANARFTMESAHWDHVLYLCDDVWLFPESTLEALRWTVMMEGAGLPLATLGLPLRHTRDEHQDYGFSSWQECLDHPEKFLSLGIPKGYERLPALFRNPFGAGMVISRKAYDELGGFAREYWAHDDVWNHKVWTSKKWVNAAYPGRGFMHYGGQSWHHGESQEYVGSFLAATGMTADESGAAQARGQETAAEKWGYVLMALGGTPSV